ncbi:MAG TPA: lysylphosphatidylglycerol synthase transmembrane domain-containing protein [Burkholderiaceae bacterium]|nr:lysylphosphatidylglycerol synthase transmembrane domain-containing protein [Burkholderiaceae bacterium]
MPSLLASRYLRLALRLAAAVALMSAAIWFVGPDRLRRQLVHVDPLWLGCAVIVMTASQWVSVIRWETIARIFGLRVRMRTLALAYAQGMTINVLLPGATLGGDALRSVRLQGLGNPLGVSALTVLLDRLSGLWILCVLSLFSGLGLGLALHLGAGTGTDALSLGLPASAAFLASTPLFLLYLLALALFCSIPWLPLRARRQTLARAAAASGSTPLAVRWWNRLCELHDLALAQRAPLGRSLWSSLLVQVLCALTLWLCATAAGGSAGYWQVQAVAAPVFLAGALPLSYGGFGARELVALAAFPLVGLPADLGLAASALYGIVGVVLGLAASPSLAVAATRSSGD